MSASRRVVAVLLTLGLLSGCGVGGSVKGTLDPGKPLTSLRSLSVSAYPGANRGNATQLDIVVTFSDNATASLPKTGPDWFRQRAALQSAFAKDIEVVSLHVPSASPAFKVNLPKRSNRGVAVYAFANYVAPQGWQPIALTGNPAQPPKWMAAMAAPPAWGSNSREIGVRLEFLEIGVRNPGDGMSASRRVVAVLLTLGLLSGCGMGGSVKGTLDPGKPLTSLRSLSVSAYPGANRGNATQLDIVVTFSDNATASLPKTGPDWFRQRAALQSAFAKDIEVVSLHVPSASPAFKVNLPKRSNRGVAVYAFANYVAPQGWQPIALTPYKHAALRLQENAIAVSAK